MKHVSPVEAAHSVRLASERLGSALSSFGGEQLREARKRAAPKLRLVAALPALPGSRRRAAQVRAERRLHLGAGVLAAAVASDSAAELYRSSSQSHAMFAPLVSVALSIAAGILAAAAVAPKRMPRMPVRATLWLTAAVGAAGVGLHIYGVSRDVGGWRNWSENASISAPPGFLGLALMGMAALALMDANDT